MKNLILSIALVMPLGIVAQLDFDTALDVVGNRISNKIYMQEKTKVAVANLVDHLGTDNELGGLIAEELTVSLLKHSRGFEVMDRAHLAAIFKEHKLAMGGLMNDSTVIELGKLESVEVLITGTIVKMGSRYKVTLKALDTETAMVIAADKEYFASARYLDQYYGISDPDPDPIDPPIEPVLSCEAGKYGTVFVNNSQSFPLLVELENPRPRTGSKDHVTFEVAPGKSIKIDHFCMGNVSYLARDSYSGNVMSKGTVYLNACDEKILKL